MWLGALSEIAEDNLQMDSLLINNNKMIAICGILIMGLMSPLGE